MKAFLFDLDGVLVDTAYFHYLAWSKICKDIGFSFSEKDNEKLKGIDRRNSLRILLKMGNKKLSETDFDKYLIKKNEVYLDMIEELNRDALFNGVIPLFEELKQKNIKIGLGSASKNALLILDKLNITNYFDAIVDGNMTTQGKPDPQVFLLNATKLGVNVENCAVLEDSKAGIDAAITANMKAIGIGSNTSIKHADLIYKNIESINLVDVLELFDE
jgi:beta-phosphoglucomutase